jgi:hypothetical protein
MPCESGSLRRNPDSGLARLAQDLTNLLTAVSTATELLGEQVPPGVGGFVQVASNSGRGGTVKIGLPLL